MITKAEIKMVRGLADKKNRDAEGLFVVEGEKMVQEALSSTFRVQKVWRREEIGDEAMDRMSLLSSPSPVLAVVAKPEPRGLLLERGLYLGLDSVRDPGNLGTIIRIADWFGVNTVFASPDTVDAFNPKVVQATMGAIFRVNVVYADLVALSRRFKEAGMPVFGTFLDGENIYRKELGRAGLLLMGNESNGISDALAAEVDERLLIPRAALASEAFSRAESLNVAVATAITLSEFARR